jgi:DNA-binding NarL/FixJ family response regulator
MTKFEQSPITVLLADDHAVVRDGLRRILEEQGDIKVIGDAANGHEAVHQVAQLCPDVVVMDVAMPELNGIEATQQVCETCPSAQVVVLSMHDAIEYIVRALQAGARGYLLKESAGVEVVNAVRAVHAGHRYLGQKISDKVIDDYMQQCEAAGAGGPLARISPREREILQLVVEGKSNAEIAGLLSLSPKTVETYRSRLMRKLDISDIPRLVKFAIRSGLTPLK